jgi:hypothetical protein
MQMPRSLRRSCWSSLALAPFLLSTLSGQNVPPAPAPQPPLQSELLDQLLGLWVINGAIRGVPVHEVADAEWVLGHQFLRIHRKQIDGAAESVVHVGFDTVLQRFVAFRVDTNGARGAETPGYGVPKGDKLEFNFDYPTSQFRETWSWDAKEKTWQFLVEVAKKDSKGATWVAFSTLNLRRVSGFPPGRGGLRGPASQGPHGPAPPPPPPQ